MVDTLSSDCPTHAVRVYVGDTDAGGVVYYATYFRFMEAARTEWLRALGYSQKTLLEQDVQLIISELNCKFIKSAVLDDELLITTQVKARGRIAVQLHQQIWRGDTLLLQADLKALAIKQSTQRPIRWVFG